MDEYNVVGKVSEGQPRLDRSVPEHMRANTKEQREKNRKRLFEAYKKSIEDYENSKKKV